MRLPLAPRLLVPPGLALFVILLPSLGEAACRTPSRLVRAGEVIDRQIACDPALTPPKPGVCERATVPACAHKLYQASRGFAFGDGARTAATPRIAHCERTMAVSITHLVVSRTREFADGERRSRAARGFLRRSVDACDGLPVRDGDAASLPTDFAGSCQAVDDGRLQAEPTMRCIRATLEAAIEDAAPTPQPPNVVLIITDDQRHDTLGWMPETLSRVGARGISFRNAFSTHPICGPARATILTGLDSPQHGVYSNGHGDALDQSATLGAALSAAGYRTALFGKYLHAASARSEPPPGWDVWQELNDANAVFYGFSLNENGTSRLYPDKAYATDLLGRRLSSFIRRSSDKPFLAVFAPGAPHGPAHPAHRHRGAFAGIEPHRPANFRESDTRLKPWWVHLLRESLESHRDDASRLDRFRERQLESLLSVDEAVAHIDNTLERLGVHDNTIVIFTSDQGLHWGEHWSGAKFSAYEESIRVPLLVRYPKRAPRPASEEAMVAHTDLVPTILDFAGVESTIERDGSSLRQVMQGGRHARTMIAVESSGGYFTWPSRSLRTERWKWIESQPRGGRAQWRELYDLQNDPFELHNLALLPQHTLLGEWLSLLLAERIPPPARGSRTAADPAPD